MKRVLIISLSYLPKFVGGAEVAIKEITDRLTDIEFHLVTNRFDTNLPREEKMGNVIVHRIGYATANPNAEDLKGFHHRLGKLWFQFAAAWKAQQLHREYRFDALWAMMAHSAGVPAALFKTFNPSVPYVLNLQEGDPPSEIERTMRPLWPLFARSFTSADVIQVLSTYLGSWARARGFSGPVEIIPNGVDVAHFSHEYPEASINEIRDSLDKKMGDVFLVTSSRLVRKNAIDVVIRALPLMPGNVSFAVLGSGPDENALRLLARELDVHKRVRWLGHIGHEELPKYLKACDIFVRPSRSEGMGSSFIEAMAAGLPVIATQEGGISDFLFDEKRNPSKPVTGWAVEKDSPESIASAVKAIMSHPEKVRAVVATAQAMVREKYDWALIASDMRTRVFEKVWTRA